VPADLLASALAENSVQARAPANIFSRTPAERRNGRLLIRLQERPLLNSAPANLLVTLPADNRCKPVRVPICLPRPLSDLLARVPAHKKKHNAAAQVLAALLINVLAENSSQARAPAELLVWGLDDKIGYRHWCCRL
jgi:hypothetical protein